MDENNKDTFITTLNEDKQILSMEFNDDDMDIDVKSSTDSDETPRINNEIEQILNKNGTHDVSSILIPRVESVDGMENKM